VYGLLNISLIWGEGDGFQKYIFAIRGLKSVEAILSGIESCANREWSFVVSATGTGLTSRTWLRPSSLVEHHRMVMASWQVVVDKRNAVFLVIIILEHYVFKVEQAKIVTSVGHRVMCLIYCKKLTCSRIIREIGSERHSRPKPSQRNIVASIWRNPLNDDSSRGRSKEKYEGTDGTPLEFV